MYMAARLSHLIGIRVIDVIVSSCNNRLSQDNSVVSLLRLLYSALAKEREIVTCFLDFQLINVLPKKTTKPLTDLLL